tara:strand:+ start:1953 stop:2471 length:519 start_codon:yes stop_codon:yes gene_type:complete
MLLLSIVALLRLLLRRVLPRCWQLSHRLQQKHHRQQQPCLGVQLDWKRGAIAMQAQPNPKGNPVIPSAVTGTDEAINMHDSKTGTQLSSKYRMLWCMMFFKLLHASVLGNNACSARCRPHTIHPLKVLYQQNTSNARPVHVELPKASNVRINHIIKHRKNKMEMAATFGTAR